MEKAWVVALVIMAVYPLIELIVGFFFNYKIYMIAKERFNIAALMGATSTFLFMITMAITPLISSNVGAWWLIIIAAFSAGIGNLGAALLVPKVAKKMGHHESEKEQRVRLEKERKE